MKDRDTPLRIVRNMGKYMAYNKIDELKADNAPIAPGWPKFCDIPLENNLMGIFISQGLDPQSAFRASTLMTACYMWRKNKIVYSFGDDLSSVLATQADDVKDMDILLADIQMHPPYPCTYIKTNVIDDFGGFWYWIGYDTDANAPQLYFVFLTADMESSTPRALTLLPGKTIRECYVKTMMNLMAPVERFPHSIEEFLEQGNNDLHILLVALQFIIYLMSENADVQDVPAKDVMRVRKKAHHTLDKASEVKEKAVGVRIGNAIRKSRAFSHSSSQGKTGIKVRPHSRRGHWHHYWVGPKDGKRSLILKWIAPTLIHQDAFSNETVVVFPVKQ